MADDAYSTSGPRPEEVTSILPAGPQDMAGVRNRFTAWTWSEPASDLPYPTAWRPGIGRAFDRLWGRDLGELVAKVVALEDAPGPLPPLSINEVRQAFPGWSVLGAARNAKGRGAPYPAAYLVGVGRAYDRVWGRDLGEMAAKMTALEQVVQTLPPVTDPE